MDHQPPPFFKRGPAPLARLFFYAAFSLALVFIDARFQTLEFVRQGIFLVTNPIQQLAHLPVMLVGDVADYFSGISSFKNENGRLKRVQLDNAQTLLRTQQLEVENVRLRKLLEVKERQQMSGKVSQILFAARDPFSMRAIIDKGQREHIVAGQPVVDELGVVGQVTRVFPFAAEVTLITDKEQAVPVQIVRNGLRSVVFGLGNGQLELRFMPANADVQNGDLLVTSGLDGIFLAGLPVAKVVHIERGTSYSFARIFCEPVAGVENFGEVIVLDPRINEPLPAPVRPILDSGKVQPGKNIAAKKHLHKE